MPPAARSSAWQPAAAVTAVAAFALLFFADLLFPARVTIFRDTFLILYPTEYVVRLLSDFGWPPLWNPYQVLGKPLAADPLAAVFYPPSWLLRTLPQALATNLSLVLHHLVAGAGFYLLLRRRGLLPLACMLGALLFSFGGIFVSYDNMVNTLQSATWLPWAVVAFERWRVTRAYRDLLAVAVALALIVLGGMPEMLVFANVAFAAVALAPGRQQAPPPLAACVAAIAVAHVVAAALCAVHLLPLTEYLAHSSRADGLRAEHVLRFSLRPLSLLAFILPRRYGGGSGEPEFHPSAHLWEGGEEAPWAVTIYLGPLALALIAGTAASLRQRLFWASLAAGAALLSLGEHLPGYAWAVETLPLLRSLRYPEKFLLIAHGVIAAAAACGLDAALRRQDDLRRIAAAAAVLAAAALVAAAVLDGSSTRALLARDLRAVGIILVLAAAVAIAGRRWPRAAALALLGLAAFDLYRANAALLPSAAWPEVVRAPRSVRAMQWAEDPPRIYSDGLGRPPLPPFPDSFLQERDLLSLEVANFHAIANLNAPASINLRDHERLAELIEEVPPPQVAPLLATFNTAYVTSPKSLDRYPGLIPVVAPAGAADAYVHRVESPAPRAFVAAEVFPIDSAADAVRHLHTEERPARRVAVARPDIPDGLPSEMSGTVRLVSYLADRVELEASMVTPGLVVLTDSYYPGWYAEIDGTPVPITRANYFTRGVFAGAGDRRIVFEYRPTAYRAGALISVATLLAAVVVALAPLRQRP